MEEDVLKTLEESCKAAQKLVRSMESRRDNAQNDIAAANAHLGKLKAEIKEAEEKLNAVNENVRNERRSQLDEIEVRLRAAADAQAKAEKELAIALNKSRDYDNRNEELAKKIERTTELNNQLEERSNALAERLRQADELRSKLVGA